ncbi:23S rRNA (uracil(1939)-C(5))-methyltransferase RlmD [Enterococcus montenegrensis]|uniref:23S rRNA (uracil(1939)-C(5))-methyltransferase RlmD n=1 Tax=Enterococcus montenegrensis TaxID=3031993 RepID=UPI00249E1565|nr:23S rRNA (uracil(1939)-C(5))-methyltransferase RlmD [Enterococcus montenegrensis]WHA10455.1 23S rRNA (uracil(1939)-C(5))-methyltransferase RlmD [Enterococcus montenegrensis]
MKKTDQVYPVEKNSRYEVVISDLTYEGMGVAKIDHYPLFVDNALPGEKVILKVIKVGKKFGIGRVVSYLEKSPKRVEVANEDLLRTGIAPLSHLTYEEQLLFKQKQIENVLQKIAKMPDIPVLPTIGMAKPIGYRNKAQIPVRRKDGQLQTGFYRKNSHDLVAIEDFYIQDPAIDAAIIKVRDILERFNVKAYNEQQHEGLLRHIVIRQGHYSRQMMVVLVTLRNKFFKGEEIAAQIHKEIPEVVSVMQNVNTEKTNVILGEHEKVLYGQDYIEDTLLGKTFRISAKSFYQVNTEQTEVLYETAFEMAALKPDDVVIDAYAGIGTIGLSVADRVKHVYGMESIPAAVSDAKKNAKLNEIDNATYLVGDATKVMGQWSKEEMQPAVIFVDPPRKGLTTDFINAACDMNPEKVIYISCNPGTMARDLIDFEAKGYTCKKIQPVDLFPQTTHVECVGILTKD